MYEKLQRAKAFGLIGIIIGSLVTLAMLFLLLGMFTGFIPAQHQYGYSLIIFLTLVIVAPIAIFGLIFGILSVVNRTKIPREFCPKPLVAISTAGLTLPIIAILLTIIATVAPYLF